MNLSPIARYGLCTLLVVSLASCGGNGGIGLSASSGSPDQSRPQGKTFLFTGGAQSFTVPAGVNSMTVVLRGAAGAVGCPRTGRGARVYAMIPVTPKEKLIVYVGGQGIESTGGFNGGGSARGYYAGDGGGGGGASDVRTGPGKRSDRILVAGGGGGEGGADGYFSATWFGCGGGGGLAGANGGQGLGYYSRGFYNPGSGGSGGTQTQGGAGGLGAFCYEPGNAGHDGALGVGGNGGRSGPGAYRGGAGAGGAGGYFGGGGGGSGCSGSSASTGGGGGGGGSSYAQPSATKVQYWQNWKNATGDGLVVFSWQ
jgi:hypothetical protein